MEAAEKACAWKRLSIDLIRKIAAALHPNEVATGLKLVDSGTAAALRDSYKTLYLAERVVWGDIARPVRAQQPWPGTAFVAHWGCPDRSWRLLTLRQRRLLLCLAASSCHAGSLDAALAHCGCALKREVLAAAAAAGNLAGCERLLGAGWEVDWWSVGAAADAGHLPVLQLLLERGKDTGSSHSFLNIAARGAGAGGQADILAWLQQAHGCRASLEVVEAAARGGQVAMLEQLLPPPPPHGLILVPAPVTAEAGDGDCCRLPRGLLWEADAAAGARVQTPSAQRERAERRLRLLRAIVQGCPVEVLQRHLEPLSRGWVTARPPEGAPAARQAAWAAWGDGDAAVGEPSFWCRMLLDGALRSLTTCWGAKVDVLLSVWGPAVAEALIRDLRIGEAAVQAMTRPHHDCLQRLQRLRGLGIQFYARAADWVSRGGHAVALAYLWDECGVPRPMDTPDPVGVFLRGCSLAVVHDSEREAGDRFVRVLQLLVTRGAVLSAEHAAMAAQCPVPEPMLLYLAEAAEPVMELGGEAWAAAFSTAARKGASLAVLRVLRQRRGAAVDLAAVACGGSEEALDWAAAELEAEGIELQPLNAGQVGVLTWCGNTAGGEWLQSRGLLPPRLEEGRLGRSVAV